MAAGWQCPSGYRPAVGLESGGFPFFGVEIRHGKRRGSDRNSSPPRLEAELTEALRENRYTLPRDGNQLVARVKNLGGVPCISVMAIVQCDVEP